MKVALYNGNVVAGDATAGALLAKVVALRSVGISSRVYTLWSNVPAPEIEVVGGLDEVRQREFHRAAGVHAFEFGLTYSLFDLLLELQPPARLVVSFHGITPRELMPVHQQPEVDRSLEQLENAKRAHIVLVASEYARRFLEGRGITPSRIRVVPLPLKLPRLPRTAETPGLVRLLFVGRLMPSKGPLDLLQALASLRDAGQSGWRLALVTNELASDPAYTARVLAHIREARLESHVDYYGRIDGRAQMAAMYAAADAVIIPTYSDSYCLPLLEALASGCAVIAYASGAVPESADGLARLVPTGDVASLREEIAQLFARAGQPTVAIGNGELVSREEFERRARWRTRDLSGAAYELNFLELIRGLHP